MGSFFTHHKGMIIGAVVVILVFFGYGMVKKPSTNPADSGLEKTIVDPSVTGGTSADDPGAAFVLQLLAIQNIKFDSAFFQDPVYRELVDQSRPLGEREVGRPNPFLDIGQDNIVFPEDQLFRNASGNAGTSSRGFINTTPTVAAPTSTASTTPNRSTTTPRR